MTSDGWQPRTREELRGGLNHIGYELEMCIGCGPRHVEAAAAGDVEAANAFLESHLLHARSLIDFLVRASGWCKDDMRRTQFLQREGWTLGSQDDVNHWRAVHDDLSKRLAHLTWRRLKAPDQWDCEAMSRSLLTFMTSWHQELSTAEPDLAAVLQPHLLACQVRLNQADPPDS